MKRSLRSFVAAIVTAGLVSAVTNGQTTEEPIRLLIDANATLQAVAREMNVELRTDVPAPTLRFQSATPLARFQDAMARQWKFRPPVFANAYAVETNEIYLMDDPSYYRRVKRTLDESLAHEYAHFLQVHYLRSDLADPALEDDAVGVQLRFRESIATLAQSNANAAS